MINRARLKVAVAGVAAVLSVVTVAEPVAADPAGTQVLNPVPTEPPLVGLMGASDAGVLYSVMSHATNPPIRHWIKPAGGPAFLIPSSFSALSGSLVFGRTFGPAGMTYRTIADPTLRRCARPESGGEAFLPTGWVAWDSSDNSYSVVTAGPSGCTSRLVTRIAKSRLVAADPSGFLVDVVVQVSFPPIHERVGIGSGAVAWAEPVSDPNRPPSRMYRWTVAGGLEPVRTVNRVVHTAAVAGDATAYLGCSTQYVTWECVLGTFNGQRWRDQ